ncbi:hypothetical protein PPERSA_05006 [Pseudocohnilembus persalinus]|uniref:Uncharacterized protein n=1 Tax=Pseudocohnilembus persalinus TaxID=266149 RepID=A0A0V0QVJ5_PSEPJ|nr:hypothetical protein PPERSA_05006 [Pseudocohnilembus persalinus]|eukprot:KRX06393.1 hypothetical protein PPERSA_05006 [Pseudocohnilembus persalinus]
MSSSQQKKDDIINQMIENQIQQIEYTKNNNFSTEMSPEKPESSNFSSSKFESQKKNNNSQNIHSKKYSEHSNNLDQINNLQKQFQNQIINSNLNRQKQVIDRLESKLEKMNQIGLQN